MSDLNIYQRINEVMKAIDYVKKDKSVNGGGQNYAAVTHDAVTALIRKHLVEQGIVVQLEQLRGELVIKRNIELGVKMHHYSGDYAVSFVNIDKPEDSLTVTINAHAADSGDKAPGKATSYATKYASLKTFATETGEKEEPRAYEAPEYTEDQKRQFDEILEEKRALDFIVFSKTVGNSVMMALNGSFEKGTISQGKKRCKDLEVEGWGILKDCANQITERLDNHDPSVTELTDELSNAEKGLLMGLLDEHQIKKLTEIKQAQV